MSAPFEFAGEPKKGQAATITIRKKCEKDFKNFLTAAKFSKSSPSATGCCEEFGDDEDEQEIVEDISNSPSIKNTQIEKLGEIGAIAYLQLMFDRLGLEYDPANLVEFRGNGCFNAIYFHPSQASPTNAIILEAKGGTSTCGDRDDGTGSGMRVEQGTAEYVAVVTNVMASSKQQDRSDAGVALQGLANYKKPRIGYLGVRTPYDKSKRVVYDPVPIFFQTV